MIARAITETPLTDPLLADIAHVDGDYYRGDQSLIASARALFDPYVEKLYIRFFNLSDRADEYPTPDTVNNFIREHTEADTFSVFNVNGSEEYNAAILGAVKLEGNGWNTPTRTTRYFKEHAKWDTALFVNKDGRSSAFIGTRIDMVRYHLLSSLLVNAVPWAFKKKDADLAREIMTSLTSAQNSDAFIAIMQRLQDERYDMRKLRIFNQLGKFESATAERGISVTRSALEDIERQVTDYLRALGELTMNRQRNEAMLRGYEEMKNGAENGTLATYIYRSKRINLLNTDPNGEYLDFIVKGYISNFSGGSETIIERAYRDPHNVIRRNCTEDFSYEDMARLMQACVDGEIKIRACARIFLRIPNGVDREKSKHYPYPEDEYATYTPNPHLDYYGCFGGNREEIAKFAREGDIIGAIEQCVNAMSSLALDDTSVSGRFINDLCTKQPQCFELPDGRVVGLREAIENIEGD